MFDSKLELGIKLPSPEGVKRVSVSFPSDADWIEWRRKKKIKHKDLGRRSTQVQAIDPEPCDLDLIRKSQRTPEGEPPVEIDEAEAYLIVRRLLECSVDAEPEREGGHYVIAMRVLGGHRTVHTLRVPTAKEYFAYDRVARDIRANQYGFTEIRVNYQAAADFYKKLLVEVKGYVDDIVPVTHKMEVINVLVQEFQGDDEEPDDAGE